MFSLICARINSWENNREAGDLRRHRTHYDFVVMNQKFWPRISTFKLEQNGNSHFAEYILKSIFVEKHICTLSQISLNFVSKCSIVEKSALVQVMVWRLLDAMPVGTRRNNNVFITSKRRRRRRFDVMKTSSLRHYCVMCPLGCHYLNQYWIKRMTLYGVTRPKLVRLGAEPMPMAQTWGFEYMATAIVSGWTGAMKQ